MTNSNKCKKIKFPSFKDDRGTIAVVEGELDIPFSIKRIYYIYDIPTGAERGSHAHKTLQQLIIPISGAFEIELDDGVSKFNFFLSDPCVGLYVPAMHWRKIVKFTSNAVLFSAVSDHYNEADYYRNYYEFCKAATQIQNKASSD